MTSPRQDLLRQLPSVSDLLTSARAADWLALHGRTLVADCLRDALEELRRAILADTAGRCGPMHVSADAVVDAAGKLIDDRTRPHIRAAINATGILLHTGLGRAIWPACVVDSMIEELKSPVTLAIDPQTGMRSDRDGRVEDVLKELTGAQAATVANNNAGATLLVLAALTSGREVIVSRGQLIEIGGSFRLPDVMGLGGCRMVEVGTTNRTHLKDYDRAITDSTAAILRVHPSNYRVVGFASQPGLDELSELAHRRGVTLIDDIGAGALVGLEQFGLGHEPTVQESITAGADIVLFSGDKLIGASQSGIIVGRQDLIATIRRHPLARALRVDKSCLMALERTLHLFRQPERLAERHPLYRMLAMPMGDLQVRAETLAVAIVAAAKSAAVEVIPSHCYLGSGSLPGEQLPSMAVGVSMAEVKPADLAQRLRLNQPAIVARIENDKVMLDVRTIENSQLHAIAEALGEIEKQQYSGATT